MGKSLLLSCNHGNSKRLGMKHDGITQQCACAYALSFGLTTFMTSFTYKDDQSAFLALCALQPVALMKQQKKCFPQAIRVNK
jgi:hypothetical protein